MAFIEAILLGELPSLVKAFVLAVLIGIPLAFEHRADPALCDRE